MADLIEQTSVPIEPVRMAALAGAPPAPFGPVPWQRLEFTIQHQLQTQWCWSAVAVSIDDYYSQPSKWTQCQMVCSEFNRSDCCENGGSEACNQPWTLDTALTRLGAFAGLEEVTDHHSLPATVTGDIEGQRPVGIRIGWDNNEGGHVIVLEGFSDDHAMVAVEDPWTGSSEFPLALLHRYNGTGTWTHIFRTKKP